MSRLATSSAVLTALSLASATSSYGFAEFARGAVTLETQARLTYDSYFIGNQRNNPGAEVGDDYFATLQPTLRYSRRAGRAELSAFAGVAILRYNENSEYDSEDLSAGFSSTLPLVEGSRLSGDVNFNYRESTVIDYDVLDRIPTRSYGGAFNVRYQLGLKTSLVESFTYSKSNRDSYSDQEMYGNQFSFVYADFLGETTLRLSHGYDRTKSSGENLLRAQLDQTAHSISGNLSRPIIGPLIGDATYGYRMLERSARESETGQTELKGAFFGLGLSGPFLPPSRFPKVQSSASLRYQESRNPGINDIGEKTLTGNMSLSWDARERTSFNIGVSRTVDLSPDDLSVENTRASIGVVQRVGLAFTLTGSIGYNWRAYRSIDRDDEMLEASLQAAYQLTRYWSAGASYSYQDNSTDGEALAQQPGYRMYARDYTRHVVSVYVTNVF